MEFCSKFIIIKFRFVTEEFNLFDPAIIRIRQFVSIIMECFYSIIEIQLFLFESHPVIVKY